jgi:hypothetical protein
MAYTFGAEDILSALGITAADWEVQDSGSDRQQDFAQTKDNEGNVVAASETAHNDRSEKSITLKVKAGTGATALTFTLGGAGTGAEGQKVVITQFSAKETYNDLATLSVTAHKHETAEDAAEHQATPVAEDVSLSLGFGVSDKGTDETYLGGTLMDCQSCELSGQVEHVDKFSNQGKFLVGASTGLRYECTEEYVDDGSEISVTSPWKQDSQAKKTTNGDFYTRTVKAHAYSLS